MKTTKTKNHRDATLVVKGKAIKLKLLADELIARGYKLRYGDDSEQTIDAGEALASLDAEKARRQSEIDLDELSYALDAIKEPVFIHDDAFCLIKINRAYTQCTDLPPEEIIGKRYWEVFPLGDGPLAGCAERVAKAGGPPEEFSITLDDGRTLNSKGFVVTDQHGRYRFSVHILEDITECKAIEENAAISEDIMSAVASSAHDAIIVAGNDGKILFWNAAAEQIFGHRQDDAIGQDMHALIIPERFHKDASEGFAVFKKTGQGPIINKTLEIQGLRKNGEEFPVELSISAFQLKGLWHAVGIVRDVSQRKQAEEKIKESEEKFRTVFESSNDAIMLFDGVAFLDCNEASMKIFGCKNREEFLGRNLDEWSPDKQPDGRSSHEAAKEKIATAYRDGQNFFEWTHIRANNEAFPAEVLLTPLRLGEKTVIQGTVRDITERKQAEDKEKKLIHDLDERVKELTALHRAATILQNEALTIPEILKEIAVSLLGAWQYPECAEARITYGDDSFETPGFSETQWGLKAGLTTTDGKNCMIEVVYLEERPLEADGPFLAEERKLINSIVEMMRASVERKQTEEKLRKDEQQFRAYFEQSMIGMTMTSKEKCCLEVNDSLCASLGYSHEELMRVTCMKLIHPDDIGPDLAQFNRMLSGEINNYAMDTRFIHKDGHIVYTRHAVSCVRKGDGSVDYVIGLVEDITERRQAEEEVRRLNAELERRVMERTAQLEVASKDLESFSYSVSHDLRAPLRAIDGFSLILLEEYQDKLDTEGQRLLNVVRDNTSLMGRLIDDILQFSRTGRLPINASTIDMEKLARSVFAELQPAVDASKLQLEIDPLPLTRGDLAMLRRVWVNLLSNAIKFSRSREVARIKVGSYIEGDEAVYFVKDNGVGFDMQYVDKLFGVFQRLHTVSEFEGTGIGLAIVKCVITRHGGRVWAEGKVDEGATVYFTLPTKE